MLKLQSAVLVVGIILCQAWSIHSQCSRIDGMSGTISNSSRVYLNRPYKACWRIDVPSDKFIQLKVGSLSLNSQNCDFSYLRITINATNENYTFCTSDKNKNPVMSLTTAEVEVYHYERSYQYRDVSFKLHYEIRDIECTRENSFHCTNLSCIPRYQVCDGVKNCENGADEIGCETGVLSLPGVSEARIKAISWLKSKRTPSWGWQENTPRAVTALFLAGNVTFDGTNLEEELMAKHTELKTAVALLKNPTNERLSILINALLVTCHNPQRFYGQNLIKYLKTQLGWLSLWNIPHPSVYLALCNANETWPQRATADLQSILDSDSKYPFTKDIQAFAMMALSCIKNKTKILNKSENSNLTTSYHRTVRRFKQHQMPDGSFGNLHTTALITQALFASGQEHAKDWKLNNTISYLIKELNSSSVDILSIYLALPILNGKSLADIAKINCSTNPRKHGKDDIVSDINDYTGPKIQIQYSLHIGNEADVIHTIYLRVPFNFTAYEVMQVAEREDPKYKFEWKRVSGTMYIYTIGKVTNDPESGHFWLTYLGARNNSASNDTLSEITSGPDNVILEEGDHLVMWYKYAKI